MSPRERKPQRETEASGESGADPKISGARLPPAASIAPRTRAAGGGRGHSLEQACRTYSESLHNLCDEQRRSSVRAWGEYLHGLQDAQIKAQKLSLAAYRSYLKAVNEVVDAESAAETFLDEQTRYCRELEAAWGPEGLARRCEEACRDYAKALGEGSARMLQGLERAYRDYLRALRDAWDDMDSDTMEPAGAAALGYGLLSAAQMGWSVSAYVPGPPE